MRLRRTGRAGMLGAASLVALFALTGCENPADPDAARVDGVDIGQDDLDDAVEAWAGVPDDPFQLTSDVEHAHAASGVAQVLSSEIVEEIVAAAAERYGLEADPALMEQIAAEIAQSSGGASPLDSLPEDKRREFLEGQALQTQLFQYLDANEWWNDDEAEIYQRLVDEGDIQSSETCVHHILVDTEAEANEILDELDAGGSFESIAEERSTDTGSGAEGGDLGCNAPGSFVAEFETAMDAAAVGDVVGPVESQFGFHLIRVDSRVPPAAIEQSGTAGWLAVLRETADVYVDRRYGTWDAETFSVLPPEGAVAPAADGLNFDL